MVAEPVLGSVCGPAHFVGVSLVVSRLSFLNHARARMGSYRGRKGSDLNHDVTGRPQTIFRLALDCSY
jgi:hypothetical protein